MAKVVVLVRLTCAQKVVKLKDDYAVGKQIQSIVLCELQLQEIRHHEDDKHEKT